MINMQWYETLNKPFLNPPEWLFAPVWIFLYITIAISFILFIKDGMNRKKIIPLIFFIIQLALNIIWTPVFFRMENIIGGLIILVFLWIFLLLTIITFFRFSKAASLLLIPYIIWSSFAFYLNFGILVLN